MKSAQSTIILILLILVITSCGPRENKPLLEKIRSKTPSELSSIPLDKGFSEYIASYTSGIVQSNSAIEIRFTPDFAAKADKSATGLFAFDPNLKGKTEWTDETTLVFTPSRLLEPGKTYTGGLDLSKLGAVPDRLKFFPLRIQTLPKDFRVSLGGLESSGTDGSSYILQGQVTASDYIEPREVESYLKAKIGRKNAEIEWDHSDKVSHKFRITGIARTDKVQEMTLLWDGLPYGVKQKGSSSLNIPPAGEFSVLGIIPYTGESQRIDIVFSDPVDPAQENVGLIYLNPPVDITTNINSNTVSIFPSVRLQGKVTVTVEQAIRSGKGSTLEGTFAREFNFTAIPPGISLEGNGVIVPSSKNLIFPFKAANLKAVDLRIIKIFDDNLPYFLQENDLGSSRSIKRFGRPVYTGKVDLMTPQGMNAGSWNLYTIDLADYIDVEPGVLYKVTLGMRRSYSLYPCTGGESDSKYEEELNRSEAMNRDTWDDPENYYYDSYDEFYYDYGFNWRDRDNPCMDAYYYPGRGGSRNILASNIGIIGKKGEDKVLHLITNDLITAMPLNGVTLDVYDLQMQKIATGTSDQNGSASIFCERKPFLVIASKDKDRNYLKVNDGSSLSLSSFDVSGTAPDNGIKAFIYGERDVWRPGDSIFLSLIIKDMLSDLPPGHPVQFELINPLEQKTDNQVQKTTGSNLLVFATKTPADAVTGNYRAVFRIGGATFTKRVRIETVKPNRLKMKLEFPAEILGGSDKVTRGDLNVKWLNGSVARNLKASVEYLLRQTKTEFEKYGQYTFDDPAYNFYAESVRIFENTTDDNGDAKITFDPRDVHAPGMLNAVFTVKAQEPGGDESITQATYKYAPYPVFVGINLPGLKGKDRMLFTDVDNEVKIVTVDEKGKPVRSEVEVNIYKISYRWWWESDEENLGSYISNEEYKPVVTTKITTSGGEGSVKFNIGKWDWGRYLIRATTPAGHSSGKILLVDWPWEYGMKGKSDGATLLSVSTDKEKYTPGDEIKLSFPSPENARVIVTLENATGVIDEMRFNTEKGNTSVSFKARPEMAPNVYAYVSIIQPHAQTVNDMPVRLYGIVPVMVEDPATRLTPVIDMPDELRSQKPFTVKVSEAGKKQMSYTLAVVDEGLLDLTGFRTPDPWKYFYAREALGVKTWDLYDYVLGAYGGTLDKIFAVGGDEALGDKSAGKARRFVPVVKFLGPYTLGPGKTNTHLITLPQYTGSVRTMIIAGSDRAYGMADKAVAVKDPLMLLVTAPRVISPGEKVALPLTLFIQKDDITDITIKAESNDLISFTENTLQVKADGTGEKDAELTFTSGQKRGVAKITITATGGGETASYSLALEIRSPNPPVSRSEFKILHKGEKWETDFRPFGIEGSNSAVIEISSIPSINLDQKLDYLISYPHGCSEQITSSAFPQLWLKDLTGKEPGLAENTAVNIREAIRKIASRQMADGGIALWPGSMQPDTWVTSYAGHFMLEAERLGYSIPSGFRQKWISFQKKKAQEWRSDTKFLQTATDQAYRLLSLALAGEPEKGAMNRLRETKDLTRLSKWLLAAAFAKSGRPEAATDLLDVRILTTEPEYYDYYYGSEIRNKAVILYTLTLLRNEEQALPVLKEICDNFNSGSWYSTQSVAWGLFAYMKWAESLASDNKNPANVKVTLNGTSWDQQIKGNQVLSKDLKITDGNNQLKVQNSSENIIYATLVRKGIPLQSDNVREEKGLTMKIEYLDMKLKPIDQKTLAQGTDFIMVARVTNNTFSSVDNLALTEMVPSGWEIRNTRLFESVTGIKEDAFDYRDFRDDRVYTYFSLDRGETRTFVVLISAAYKGEYYQPAISCEAMYKTGCYSRFPGTTVKVTGK